MTSIKISRDDTYSKAFVKRPISKRQKIGFKTNYRLMKVESIAECSNEGRKYCRMLQGEHSAILSTFIKLPFVIRSLFCLSLVAVLHRFYCIKTKKQAKLTEKGVNQSVPKFDNH